MNDMICVQTCTTIGICTCGRSVERTYKLLTKLQEETTMAISKMDQAKLDVIVNLMIHSGITTLDMDKVKNIKITRSNSHGMLEYFLGEESNLIPIDMIQRKRRDIDVSVVDNILTITIKHTGGGYDIAMRIDDSRPLV